MSDIWESFGVTVSSTGAIAGAGTIGRSVTYDPTLSWDPDTGTWVSDATLLAAGGGRYHQQIVMVGRDVTGYGKVYYG
jgi:hypothetical protein